jgi:hypothetical protein
MVVAQKAWKGPRNFLKKIPETPRQSVQICDSNWASKFQIHREGRRPLGSAFGGTEPLRGSLNNSAIGTPKVRANLSQGALLGFQTYSRWNSGITTRPER